MEATLQTDPAAKPQSPTARTYAQASIPEPYRILGLRLRPFSLGHYLLLQRFGCGYRNDSPTREDLLLGVLICSMRHQEFLEFIEQKNFTRELKKWGKRIGLFDFPAKSALFEQYLKASLQEPDYIPTHPGGESTGDWAQNLKITLTTRLHYSEPEAHDCPLSKALADYYNLAESEGHLRILTEADRADANANAIAAEQLAAVLEESTRTASAERKEVTRGPAT